jgi:hypothetical protein
VVAAVLKWRRISCSGSSPPILFRSPAQQVVDRRGRNHGPHQFELRGHCSSISICSSTAMSPSTYRTMLTWSVLWFGIVVACRLAVNEFVLAAEGRRWPTCTGICRILEPPPTGCSACDRAAFVAIPVSTFLGAPTSAPPVANLLAFVAQNSSRRPRSGRLGQPRILRSDAVLMVVGAVEMSVLGPAWMGGWSSFSYSPDL